MNTFAPTATITNVSCTNCDQDCKDSAKYCKHCGSLLNTRSVTKTIVNKSHQANVTAPKFAYVPPVHMQEASNELKVEAHKTMILLARERVFLYMHWLMFIGINLFGFFLSYKCSTEFIGDDMTRLMMSAVPFLWINCIGLMCIVPIRGTRKQINKLKDQLQHIKLKLEYDSLIIR